MKVQLVNAPLESGYCEMSRSGAYQPLNLLALSSFLSQRAPDVSVEVLDGDVLNMDEILSRLGADIVGLSPKILTYSNCLKLAEAAKARGSTVVMGGVHASALADVILANRWYIDAVVVGDGEEALLGLATGLPSKEIPNLVHRTSGGQTAWNAEREMDLGFLPESSNGSFDFEPYFARFAAKFHPFGFSRAASIYSSKGCSWAARGGGCVFCRGQVGSVRKRNPRLVWAEIQHLVEQYGIDFIWDVSDSATSDVAWLKEFAETRPRRLSPAFLLYARANDVTPEVSQLLRDLNCFEVLVGVESGDDERLRACNKGTTVDDSLNAVRNLRDAGIRMYPSFTLGLPGETEDSLRKTIAFAKRLVGLGNVSQLACSTLIPLPGSPSMAAMLATAGLQEKYEGRDLIPVEEARRDWAESFCSIEYEELIEALNEILALTDMSSSFGRIRDTSSERPPRVRAPLQPPPEVRGLDFTADEKQEARRRDRMLLLTILTDMGCNLKCPYCFTRGYNSRGRAPLSLGEYNRVFREAKDLGVRSVWWVGVGEPLLYGQIWELLELINDVGLTPLVYTNCTLLTAESARRLFDLGVTVYAKLNSFDPNIQDMLAGGVPGTYGRMRRGIESLLDAGFGLPGPHRLALQTVITKLNVRDLPDLYRWTRRLGMVPMFEMIVHTGFHLTPELLSLEPDVAEHRRVFELLRDVDETEFGYTWIPTPPYVGRQCDKYHFALTLDPCGDVMSCAASRASVGDIRKESLVEIWSHPFLRQIRRIDELIQGKCADCPIECTGCRAEAFAATGSVFAEFGRCWR